MTDTDKLYGKPHKQQVYGKSYIDTDKLKRLAEDRRFGGECMPVAKTDILALIAENERLKEYGELMQTSYVLAASERDEAVALLREIEVGGSDELIGISDSYRFPVVLSVGQIRALTDFLARIDSAKNP